MWPLLHHPTPERILHSYPKYIAVWAGWWCGNLSPPPPGRWRLQRMSLLRVTSCRRHLVPRLASRRSFQRPPRGGGGTADQALLAAAGLRRPWAAALKRTAPVGGRHNEIFVRSLMLLASSRSILVLVFCPSQDPISTACRHVTSCNSAFRTKI